MSRTTDEAIYFDNLDQNDLEIKTARNALAFETNDRAYRDSARLALIAALERKRQNIAKAQAFIPTTTAERLDQDLEQEIEQLKRIQAAADNPDPTDLYDDDWTPSPEPPLLTPLSTTPKPETRNPKPVHPTSEPTRTNPDQPEPQTTGYANPPIQHQFKPGHPGGPGRPKGSVNIRTILIQELSKYDAKKARAIVNKLVTKAIRGDIRAIAQIVRMEKRAKPSQRLP